nr:immunoglobulin light chain junction region [Macaca mulatta]MOX48837.1 immunoglobulin light chain junction region [Macaca mulatta]MOX49089.1 immunoglobulin light chain junction region [Macaca mulatta]MOX50819.1 immunoglobulin light chain junction region [Macaca mulatta]MOX50897.1 immunoglobulin light chain junction region [Macaca mulatta]
CQQGDSKPITF